MFYPLPHHSPLRSWTLAIPWMPLLSALHASLHGLSFSWHFSIHQQLLSGPIYLPTHWSPYVPSPLGNVIFVEWMNKCFKNLTSLKFGSIITVPRKISHLTLVDLVLPPFASIVTSVFLLVGCFKLTLTYFIYLSFSTMDCEFLEDWDGDLVFCATPKSGIG